MTGLNKKLKFNIPLILLVFLAVLRIAFFVKNNEEKTYQKEPFFDDFLIIQKIRSSAIDRAHKYLPSPASELLLGMTIGIDQFDKLPKFKEMLIKTGTIHVVVVSGYNISLVYTLVWSFLGSFYDRTKLAIGGIVAFLYAVLSGFDPPVIRSWIMGTIAYLGKYYGRSFPVLRVLIVSGLLMIIWSPGFLFSLSFQLSFMATLSLILFSGKVEKLKFLDGIPMLFREDFVATVAAQVLVWPLISIYFGRVSLISILVNSLILWTVPIATVLGGVFLIPFFVGDFISRIIAFLVYVPLDIFADLIEFFSQVSYAQINFKISLVGLIGYYFFAFVVLYFPGFIRSKKLQKK